jgi:YbgC/YbaW family acyl-CoA thioester hydrolase
LSVEWRAVAVDAGRVNSSSSSGDAAPETPIIATEVQVMFFDTDCAAVVHNIAYLRFIEIARTLLAEQLGMGLVDMARTKLYPVVVRTEIDYRKPALLGDKLVVHGRLEGVDRLRFWVAFEIRRPADGALIATSRQMLAVIQMPAGKPVRLPADWGTRFAHLPVVRPATR